jgi:hypothetical protein
MEAIQHLEHFVSMLKAEGATFTQDFPTGLHADAWRTTTLGPPGNWSACCCRNNHGMGSNCRQNA